ncbi:hypothetical protein BKI52_12360 [marine bacterium AO1-C]|nr:hypothetical protein BKI52_12360 [marine bacterium AO1-C]
MNASNKVRYTPEEYLSLGADFDLRQECNFSNWLALPNTTQNHQRVSKNLLNLFKSQLLIATEEEPNDGGYQVFSRSIRFEVIRDRFYSNPDIFIGQHPEDIASPLFKRYPILVGEVLSKITDEYDRHFKLKKYFTNTTLQTYLLASQYTRRVELYHRQPESNEWQYQSFDSLEDVIHIPSLDLDISIPQIYEGTGLDKKKLPPLNQ